METVILDTPETIERGRWLTVRQALRLEIRGIKATGKGRSARILANEITGKECRTNRESYTALDKHITTIIGGNFARPLDF